MTDFPSTVRVPPSDQTFKVPLSDTARKAAESRAAAPQLKSLTASPSPAPNAFVCRTSRKGCARVETASFPRE